MKRLILVGLAVAVVSHFGVIAAAPYVFMSGAMKRVSREGTRINVWNHGPRVSEKLPNAPLLVMV